MSSNVLLLSHDFSPHDAFISNNKYMRIVTLKDQYIGFFNRKKCNRICFDELYDFIMT